MAGENILDAKLFGQDAGIRELLEKLARLEKDIRDIRANIGRFGSIYTENGITIGNGGSLVGEGGGEFNWSGSADILGPTTIGGDTTISGDTTVNGPIDITGAATIGGDTTISGTTDISGQLTINNGIVGLTEFNKSGASSSSNWSIPRSWTSLATVNVSKPAWATSAIVMSIGSVKPYINDGAYAFVRSRLVGTGGTSPEQGTVFQMQGMGQYTYGSSATANFSSITSGLPSTFTMSVQAIYDNTSFSSVPAHANNRADVKMVILFLS